MKNFLSNQTEREEVGSCVYLCAADGMESGVGGREMKNGREGFGEIEIEWQRRRGRRESEKKGTSNTTGHWFSSDFEIWEDLNHTHDHAIFFFSSLQQKN